MGLKTYVYPHAGNKGTVIEVRGLFTGSQNIVLQMKQFLGVSECLTITAAHPEVVQGQMDLCMDLPQMPDGRVIMWISQISAYRHRNGIRYYVPHKVWTPKGEQLNARFMTMAICMSAVGRSGRVYYLVTFPQLTRKAIVDGYEHVLERLDQQQELE